MITLEFNLLGQEEDEKRGRNLPVVFRPEAIDVVQGKEDRSRVVNFWGGEDKTIFDQRRRRWRKDVVSIVAAALWWMDERNPVPAPRDSRGGMLPLKKRAADKLE